MSNNADLTIIAIAVGVMAIMAIIILLLLVRVLLRIIALERAVTHELQALSTDVRDMVQNVRQTSDRINDTVGKITHTVTWAGRIASLVASVSQVQRKQAVKAQSAVPDPAWWLTGLKWGLSALTKPKVEKTSSKSRGGPPQAL